MAHQRRHFLFYVAAAAVSADIWRRSKRGETGLVGAKIIQSNPNKIRIPNDCRPFCFSFFFPSPVRLAHNEQGRIDYHQVGQSVSFHFPG